MATLARVECDIIAASNTAGAPQALYSAFGKIMAIQEKEVPSFLMDTSNQPLSDADLLAKFRKCSPETGERLVLYPELKKRGLPDDFNDETLVLFRGTTPGVSSSESMWIIIGCAIVGTVCIQFERGFLLALIVFCMVLLPLLNSLNIIFYRVIYIYPDRISIATCLCLDGIKLKARTIKFGEHGLYINAYAGKPLIHASITPWVGRLYFRAVTDVEPLLQCILTVKMINSLLYQLNIFFEGLGLDVFMASGSPDIPLDEMRASTDLESFCLRQAVAVNRAGSAADDVNWLRLIAEVGGRPIAEEMRSRPLPKPPDWLEPGEHLVMCLNGFLPGFRIKGYLILTNNRIVRATLSGDYVAGINNDDPNLKLSVNPGYWGIDFNTNITGQKITCPYPLHSIVKFLASRRPGN